MPRGIPKTAKAAAKKAKTQFKPGKSGNPGGAPKGKKLSTVLLEIMDSDYSGLEKLGRRKGLTVREKMAIIWVKSVIEGSNQHLGEALNRTEGRVKEVHEIQDNSPHAAHNLDEMIVMMQRLKKAREAAGE